jgi:hypothetical protein
VHNRAHGPAAFIVLKRLCWPILRRASASDFLIWLKI